MPQDAVPMSALAKSRLYHFDYTFPMEFLISGAA
jgi:hypothetical protein